MISGTFATSTMLPGASLWEVQSRGSLSRKNRFSSLPSFPRKRGKASKGGESVSKLSIGFQTGKLTDDDSRQSPLSGSLRSKDRRVSGSVPALLYNKDRSRSLSMKILIFYLKIR